MIPTAYKETINQAVKNITKTADSRCWLLKRLPNPLEQVKLPDYASYKVARELYRQHSKTDSLLIQGRWRSVAYIQELEDDTQKPAVSSTAASLWWVMHVLEIKVPIPRFGKLLRG